MESTNEEVMNVYWGTGIEDYTSSLAALIISAGTNIYLKQDSSVGLIQYSFNNATWTNIGKNDWPVTFNNIGTGILTVNITTDLTISSDQVADTSLGYFVIGSSNIVVEGGTCTVTIKNIANYNGLIKNDSNPGKTGIVVNNIGVLSMGSTIKSTDTNNACGWLFNLNTASNAGIITVSKCYSNGPINTSCGGLFGTNAGNNGGNITVRDCYSSGTLGLNAGGIFGKDVGSNNAVVVVSKCFSTGAISQTFAGGICGWGSGYLNKSFDISQCFSTGIISGYRSGAICGNAPAYQGKLNITDCYSSGTISGQDAGGICGNLAGYAGILQMTNCYSSGAISGQNSGGIFGYDSGTGGGVVKITNCYSSGLITGTGAQGIYAPTSGTPTLTNCYSANGTWSNTNNLTGKPTYDISNNLINPVGTTWIDTNSSQTTPWLFSTFGYSPYTSTQTQTYAQTIIQGNTSNQALNPTGHTYTIVAINNQVPSNFPSITINSSTGAISTTNSTPVGTYTIKIMQNSDYTITNFDLNVNARCFLETTKILCVINGVEQWIQIKDIEPNSDILVKTYAHGDKKVLTNTRIEMLNTCEKTKHKLYMLSMDKNKDLFEDLYVSGQHGILLNNHEIKKQTNFNLLKWNRHREIDGKTVVMAYLHEDFEEVNDTKTYFLHHLVLENTNVDGQYGIWSNGVLSESMSIEIGKQGVFITQGLDE